MSRTRRPDCDLRDALTDGQAAALTGFSSRAIRALAHLREAWCIADPGNKPHVEQAIRALLATHSLNVIPASCARVLAHGLDPGLRERILHAVGLALTRSVPS